jgi:hypothetical protein
MREKSATLPTGADATALTTFLNAHGHDLVPIQRWARLWLPNGQTAQTTWREALRENGADMQVSRNVKVSPPSPAWNMHLSTPHQVKFAGTVRFAEVQYYTRLAVEQPNLEIADEDEDSHWKFLNVAVIRLYSLPDPSLLKLSSQTVVSCTLTLDLVVVAIKNVLSVVAMVPHCPMLPSGVTEDRCFLVEKPGLEISDLTVQEDGLNCDQNEI